MRVKDYDIELDCEYFSVLVFFQVFNVMEFIVYFDIMRDIFIVSEEECEKVFFSFKIVGEFKFRYLVDLELLGKLDLEGLFNFDCRVFYEENVLGFEVELVKENGSLF